MFRQKVRSVRDLGRIRDRSELAKVDAQEFREARNDPTVRRFLEKAQEEGNRLRREGLLHS